MPVSAVRISRRLSGDSASAAGLVKIVRFSGVSKRRGQHGRRNSLRQRQRPPERDPRRGGWSVPQQERQAHARGRDEAAPRSASFRSTEPSPGMFSKAVALATRLTAALTRFLVAVGTPMRRRFRSGPTTGTLVRAPRPSVLSRLSEVSVTVSRTSPTMPVRSIVPRSTVSCGGCAQGAGRCQPDELREDRFSAGG